MREISIRAKVPAAILFAVMIIFSLYIQKQQREDVQTVQTADEAAVQNGAGYGSVPRRIALTFDDGPHPIYTETLLEGLKERGVKATFFVVGENIPGHEELISRMAAEGHVIGNHTYDHADISRMSSEKACEELEKTSRLVEEITGNGTAYVRPPFGNWDDSLDGMVTMLAVKWTIDPLDWTTANTAQIVERVVSKASENDIILLHDYYASSVEAALQIVDILKQRGFEFVTVEELLLE
ncbi:MAG: polysaccharide deacetylase family protein [Eubacteriales bacterium]|nr:polysaccharide deacetylase family protein [Eubacteriales bacterium]